jgi:hypothetical protein
MRLKEGTVKNEGGSGLQRAGRWGSARAPAIVAGLLLVERLLINEVGSPVTLLRVLGDLGDVWADPVGSVLALMELVTETLVGYVLAVLVLRSLCMLPGSVGRLASRLSLLL